MENQIKKILNRLHIIETGEITGEDWFYFIFRVLTGLMFFQYGAQKLFGVLGGELGSGHGVPLFSLLGLAGIIEFFGGFLITFGVFTRLIALISTVEMVIAYFMVHAPRGFFPVQNEGVLAIMFFVNFLIMTLYGGGKGSLEKAVLKKELF